MLRYGSDDDRYVDDNDGVGGDSGDGGSDDDSTAVQWLYLLMSS